MVQDFPLWAAEDGILTEIPPLLCPSPIRVKRPIPKFAPHHRMQY
jgi:hypothetical protein